MFGTLLKELREGKYSQRELAQYLSVSHSYISKIENSETINISDDLIKKMAEVLSCEEEILYLAAQRLHPDWLKISETDNMRSVYDTLKSKLSRGTAHQVDSLSEAHLISEAIIQSPFGYAIINMDSMSCRYISRNFRAHMGTTLKRFNLFEIIPDLMFLLTRCHGQNIHRQCLLPILQHDKYHFVDFFLHTFEIENTPYALLEFIDGKIRLEAKNNLLGTSFCFENFFSNATYGILATQHDSLTQSQKLLNFNDAFCDLLGYTKKELLLEVVYFERLEYLTDASHLRLALLEEHKSLHFTIVLIKKDGHKIPLEVNAHAYYENLNQGFIYTFKSFPSI